MQQQNNCEAHIRQLEELLENKTTQLNEVTRELDDLSFAVSHDLKAPIRAVAGFSSILKDELGDNISTEAKRVLAVIEKNAGKLTDMLNEIINFSSLSKKDILFGRVNMLQLLNGTLQTLLSENELNTFTIVTGNIADCHADENMMRQVWLNLVNMALLYAEKNNFFKLQVESVQNHQQVMYSIQASKANSHGANNGSLPNLTNTITSRESFDGSGASLAFVKRVLFKHGGNFWVQAIPGQEYVFSFSVPAL